MVERDDVFVNSYMFFVIRLKVEVIVAVRSGGKFGGEIGLRIK